MIGCGCGFTAVYDEYGCLKGDEVPYDNITAWDKWQTAELTKIADEAGQEDMIFEDEDMKLTEIFSNHTTAEVGTGSMALYKDRLECCGKIIPIKDLDGFAIHGAQTVDMSIDGHFYEISSDLPKCTRKYMTVIDYFGTCNNKE